MLAYLSIGGWLRALMLLVLVSAAGACRTHERDAPPAAHDHGAAPHDHDAAERHAHDQPAAPPAEEHDAGADAPHEHEAAPHAHGQEPAPHTHEQAPAPRPHEHDAAPDAPHEHEAAPRTHGQEPAPHTHEQAPAPRPHEHEVPPGEVAPPGRHDHDHDSAEGGDTVEIPRDAQELLGITVREVGPQPLPSVLSVPGTVRGVPHRTAEVSAPLWGRIEYAGRPWGLGDRVEKDQVLAHVILELAAVERHPLLDRTIEVEGAFQEAEVRTRQAEDDYQRALRLAQADPAFEPEARWRRELLAQARRELGLLRSMVQRQAETMKRRDPNVRQVVSPISGIISGIHFTPGEINPEGNFRKLFTIADLSEVWVEAQVFERDIPSLRHIQAAAVRTPADPDRAVAARVQAIGAKVDPATRHLPVWLALDNRERLMRPGMPVDVRLTLGPAEDVLAVPAGALVSERGETFVFVATSSTTFERRVVQAGRSAGGLVEILRGLQPGSRVATNGVYYLRRAQAGLDQPDAHGGHSH